MKKSDSNINQLINKLCPNGVEFSDLGEVCKFKRGSSITKKDTVPGNIPVVAGGQQPAYYHSTSNRSGQTIVVSSSGAYAGFISFWETPVFLSDSFSVDPEPRLLRPKYVFYYLKNLQGEIHASKKGSGVPHVHGSDLAKIRIPVPPIEVQKEIVRILDSFTQLEAELEAELEARRKQYEHYRSDLLVFSENARWVTISEICKVSRGRVMSKDYLAENVGEYPVYSSQTASEGVFGSINTYDYDGEYITWTTDGANAGSIFYRNGKFSITNVCGLLKVRVSGVSTRYLAYILSTVAKKYVSAGMGNPKLMSNVMANIKVQIPSLSEQERIVSILDKFDALVNDISTGLPAEIAARRKQYEYYRNRLLTFTPLTK